MRAAALRKLLPVAGLLVATGLLAAPAATAQPLVTRVVASSLDLPQVTSHLYSESEALGGVGRPGDFTFSPGGAADEVVQYSYSLNGGRVFTVAADSTGTATVSITPDTSSFNELAVEAFDGAGHRSGKSYFTFLVARETGSWYWSLDEGTGDTASSRPVDNRPALISGSGVTWSPEGRSGGSANFTGAGEFVTGSTVLRTTSPAGFSVAAWVRLPALPDGERTAISQDGENRSMFSLGYRDDLNVDGSDDGSADPAWCFTLAETDSAAAAETRVCTTDDVTPGEWTSLTGVVNPVTGKIRLYVNGTPGIGGSLTETAGVAQWDATGVFAIGRGLDDGPAGRWIGGIDEVRAAPRVWNDVEINTYGAPVTEWPEE
ncbi:LamG domain-containing protein [Kineosporia sp. J2-2]|uniref:LamG domain-containing protein n=1 Tax=Kineosporia corallincola TaxID=2835133 RepID=A0ABS5TG80_9ACTN|nr:LamG domain-containing protein [Kineosporia corallincola]MBT0768609.1 LamG domain-containing protein [Kineosporia corallincola]